MLTSKQQFRLRKEATPISQAATPILHACNPLVQPPFHRTGLTAKPIPRHLDNHRTTNQHTTVISIDQDRRTTIYCDRRQTNTRNLATPGATLPRRQRRHLGKSDSVRQLIIYIKELHVVQKPNPRYFLPFTTKGLLKQ